MEISQLPKGHAVKSSPGLNPIARYKQRYFEGENASGAPFVHAIVGLFLIGYTIDCTFLPSLLPRQTRFRYGEARLEEDLIPYLVFFPLDNMHLKHHKNGHHVRPLLYTYR